MKPKQLRKHVRTIADQLRLRDWTIDVEVGKPKLKDRCAECRPVYGRKCAIIRFHPDYLDHSELHQTVIHELIHLHLYGWWDMCFRDAGLALSEDAYDIFIEGIRRQMEYGVDALADVIAPLLQPTNG